MLARQHRREVRQPGADHDHRQAGLADLVAGRAQRGDVVRAEVLHLVDEDGDALADVGREPAEVGEQLHQVDLDVPGVGSPLHRRDVDAGVPLVAQLGAGPGLALREGPDHAEHVVDVVGLRVAELADGLVQGARQRAAQALVGAGLELAGPPVAPHGGGAERVEQHRLADSAQAGQDQAALRAAVRHPLEDDVEGTELLVTPRELGRPLAGTGRVRVPDRVHAGTVSGTLGAGPRFPRRVSPRGRCEPFRPNLAPE